MTILTSSSGSNKARRKKVPAKWIRSASDHKAIEEGFWFDEDAGARVIYFIERFCRQTKGSKWAGQRVVLLDWQKDLIHRIYGWKRRNGTRRFRTVYLEIPKKNGKSLLLSCLLLYHLIADDEPGAECYVNAFDKSQATIIFDAARHMVRLSPELNRRLKVTNSQKLIEDLYSASFARANSKEAASKDGASASFVAFDELHRQRSDDMYSMFRYAGRSRSQPLQIDITTAGVDRTSICYQVHEYSVAQNEASDFALIETSHLGVIYGATDEDDLESPAVWKRCNPSGGVTFDWDDFAADFRRARLFPSEWEKFIRLSLNVWTCSSARAFDLDAWNRCAATEDNPFPSHLELLKCPCFGGGDLSTTVDLTAIASAYDLPDGRVALRSKLWIPDRDLEERERRDRVPYKMWIRAGHLDLMQLSTVDYDVIRREVCAVHRETPYRIFNMDPWNAVHVGYQLLNEDGVPVNWLRQGFASLSDPTKQLERLILGGQLIHDNNPVLTWCVSNAVKETDAAGNVKLSKKLSRERIDGAAASVNAMAGLFGTAPVPQADLFFV